MIIKTQPFLSDGDQQVGRYGNPYLCLDRVLAGAKEHLDAKVLLDPFEEQLYLPALAVKIGNQLGLQAEVVGQKHEPFSSVVPDYHATQCRWVILARLKVGQHAGLIAQHSRIDSIHRMRVTSPELGVAFGTSHKEDLRLVNHEQPGEVRVAPIHQVKRARLQHQMVHNIDFVRLAVADVNEAGDVASQVQQRVQLDGRLGRAKRCPGKHRQTQVDGAGVERVDCRVEFQSERLRSVQGPRQANQLLGEVGINLRRACGIRIGQVLSSCPLEAKFSIQLLKVELYTIAILAQVTAFQALNAWARSSRVCLASRL